MWQWRLFNSCAPKFFSNNSLGMDIVDFFEVSLAAAGAANLPSFHPAAAASRTTQQFFLLPTPKRKLKNIPQLKTRVPVPLKEDWFL